MKVSLIVAAIVIPLALLIAYILVWNGTLELRQSYFLVAGVMISTFFNILVSFFDKKR